MSISLFWGLGRHRMVRERHLGHIELGMGRYCILYKYGGTYIDIKAACKLQEMNKYKPFEPLMFTTWGKEIKRNTLKMMWMIWARFAIGT